MKINLGNYQNSWYYPGASKIKIFCWMLISAIIFRISIPFPNFMKVQILRFFGAKIESGVVIKPSVNIKYPWNLIIGKNSWVGEGVWIDNLSHVYIGDNCCISQGVYLLTGNHDYTSSSFDLIVSDIKIENEAWLGAKSIICPGVTAKKGSVLSVGSITSSDLDSFTIYRGNPAKKIKERKIQ